jgi:hypothetical protein
MPTPLSMDTEVALPTDQESVVLPLEVIVVADAEKLDMVGAELPPEDEESFPPQPDMTASASSAMHRVRRRTDKDLETCFSKTRTTFMTDGPLSIKRLFDWRERRKMPVFFLNGLTVARFKIE